MLEISRLMRSALKGWMLPAVFILAAQAAIISKLSIPERDLPVPQLQNLPAKLGQWQAYKDGILEQDVLDFLRPDGYILRDYASAEGSRSINLFVAYFKSLQNTVGPHSPRDCLPGAGWNILSSEVRTLPIGSRTGGLQVNQFILEKAGKHIVAIYWYQNDRHIWAEEYKAKLTMLPDLIRYRRSDVSLVRIIESFTGVVPNKELADCQEFVDLILPSLFERFRAAD